MKTKKKIMLTALSTLLVGSLVAGGTMVAFADEATKDHEYEPKFDKVWEDFDKTDLSNVAVTGNATVGEAPYLHVEYTSKSTSAADIIYKQGSQSLENLTSTPGGSLTFRMRAPEGGVTWSDLILALRGPINDDGATYPKSMEYIAEKNGWTALSTEWQQYTLTFSNTYDVEQDDEDNAIKEYYMQDGVATEYSIMDSILQGFHIYAKEDTQGGTLDISYIKMGNTLLNDFTGGTNVQDTAKAADAGTWWAGSSEGTIVKPEVKLENGGEVAITGSVVGNYKYAVIETTGGAATNLTVATHSGNAWGTAADYDGYSVTLTGSEDGFKIANTGNDAVKIVRIYLTNVETAKPATAVPVIDASSVQVLENFSIAQETIPGNYNDGVAQVANENLWYRLAQGASEAVTIKDGHLEIDGAKANGYATLKFFSKSVYHGDYVVLKLKVDGMENPNLTDFRFSIIDSEDSTSDVKWVHDLKSGVGFASNTALDETNPYKSGDWYYLVVNIEETGFPVKDIGYGGLELAYGGTGKLVIDEVFFADKLANIENDVKAETYTNEGNDTDDYKYSGWINIGDTYGTATSMSFDIIPTEDNFDVSSLRFEFAGKTRFAYEGSNDGPALYLKGGKTLNQLTYTKGVATHVEVDLDKCGLTDVAWWGIHVHVNRIKGFKIENLTVHTSTAKEDLKNVVETPVTVDKTIDFVASEANYEYAGGIDVAYGQYSTLKFTLTPGEQFNGYNIRLGINGKDYYVGTDGEDGRLALKDTEGKLLIDPEKYAYEEGKPVTIEIDLPASGITDGFKVIYIHTAGTSTGNFTVSDISLKAYENNYADTIKVLDDETAPTVKINNALTATAGDVIEVKYTASDNVTANENLKVEITVEKNGEKVTLNGNKFTAEEGVYTVTVTVTDERGNVSSDTVQIEVSGKGGCAGGCGSTTAGDVILGGGIGILCLGGMLVLTKVLKKKKEN